MMFRRITFAPSIPFHATGTFTGRIRAGHVDREIVAGDCQVFAECGDAFQSVCDSAPSPGTKRAMKIGIRAFGCNS